MKFSIRLLYLYLFSFVGLIIVVIGSVQMVNLGMRIFVFKEADKYTYSVPQVNGDKTTKTDAEIMRKQAETEQTRNRQREFTNAFAMIVVGMPLYLYHWKKIQKENRNK